MQALKNKLQKHKTTRRLCSAPSNEADDQIDVILREDLAWQQRLVDSLLHYSTAVASAMNALTAAHEALLEGGIDEADCTATPVARVLLANLQNAVCITGEAAVGTDSLRALSTTLAGYAEDLRLADIAAAEQKRYDAKINDLSDVVANRPSSKVTARMERNRGKLDVVVGGANVAHERASSSLQACVAQKGVLLELADSVIKAAAEGLGSMGKCSATRWERLSGCSAEMPVGNDDSNCVPNPFTTTQPQFTKNTAQSASTKPWTDLSCSGTGKATPWLNGCCNIQSMKGKSFQHDPNKFIRTGQHTKVEA